MSVPSTTTVLPATTGGRDGAAAGVAGAALAVGWWAAKAGAGVVQRGVRLTAPVVTPVVALALQPPLVPTRFTPGHLLDQLSATWVEERVEVIEVVESFTTVSGAASISAVLDRVDLQRLVDEVLGRLDLTQLVLDHVDLPRIAQEVIDAVDLPQIVRQSSGSIASETIESIRVQGIDADRAVERLVDRLFMRRRPETP